LASINFVLYDDAADDTLAKRTQVWIVHTLPGS